MKVYFWIVKLRNMWSTDQGKLHKQFDFRNFIEAFAFVTKVAMISERVNHHPEICIRYKTVELHFLIVGHTHCSVDQYFSVLSKVGHVLNTIKFDYLTYFGISAETGPSPFHCDAIIYGSFLSTGAWDASTTSQSIAGSRCYLRFCGCNETVHLPRD